ncbi:hypothetical protein [Thermococcus henrietii]|uniref:hypothetical protein n=1 Tax=Thermococcus henrietii TaxID=2016361 RepID=UPI0011AB7F2B|nr:hypothetical protein [Thermococcus henrietii]
MLIDNLKPEIISEISKKALIEKARRLPHHSLHRWWSRRFALLYRGMLAAYISKNETQIYQALENPMSLRPLASGKTFYEPFMGGGTGLSEAAIMGYNAYGVDINPVAVRIAQATINLLQRNFRDLEKTALSVLEDTEKLLGWSWTYNGLIISYVFVTRGRIPSWVSRYQENNREIKILRCPICGHIFESSVNEKTAVCPHCNSEFKVTYNPEFKLKGPYLDLDLDRNSGDKHKKLKIWGAEVREKRGNRWKKKFVTVENIEEWLIDSHEKSREFANEARSVLDKIDLKGLLEGKRLIREGIGSFSSLYTPRQLATFVAYSKATRELPSSLKVIFSIALSESAKTSNLVAKWHSPIGEPVPAAAMKTYWVPEYTVETNPIARIPGTLRPLSRNGIPSSLRRAVKISVGNMKIQPETEVKISKGNSENFIPPVKINISIVDPPYMDTVRSYASLSLIHYGALRLFDEISQGSFDYETLDDLTEVEKSEIPRDREAYTESMEHVFKNISSALTPEGRVVLFYNRKEVEDWIAILEAAKNAGLTPTAIYWSIGEPPGGLGRSHLKGLFILIFSNMFMDINKRINIIFNEPLDAVQECMRLDKKIERKALNSIKKALAIVYSLKVKVL